MSTEKKGFGYIDDSKDLGSKAKSRGEFGLNTGNITVFEYNDKAGKDGSAGDAIDITFKVKEQEYRRRIYDVTRVYHDNNEIQEGDPNYIEKFNEAMAQAQGVVKHVMEALGVTKEVMAQALATPPSSFAEWAMIMTSLVGDGFQDRPVDGFLEYEWKIGAKNKKTFLQLPKTMKGGSFLCASVPHTEDWVAITTDEGGLVYMAGPIEHPITKTANFMESNKAIQQHVGGSDSDGAAIAGSSPETATAATWGAPETATAATWGAPAK